MRSITQRLEAIEKRRPADDDRVSLCVVVVRPGCEPGSDAEQAELDALCDAARRRDPRAIPWVTWPDDRLGGGQVAGDAHIKKHGGEE